MNLKKLARTLFCMGLIGLAPAYAGWGSLVSGTVTYKARPGALTFGQISGDIAYTAFGKLPTIVKVPFTTTLDMGINGVYNINSVNVLFPSEPNNAMMYTCNIKTVKGKLGGVVFSPASTHCTGTLERGTAFMLRIVCS